MISCHAENGSSLDANITENKNQTTYVHTVYIVYVCTTIFICTRLTYTHGLKYMQPNERTQAPFIQWITKFLNLINVKMVPCINKTLDIS